MENNANSNDKVSSIVCDDNSPLLSIIIPVYNVADYLSQCIESIMRQNYHNLEIILIDDGSTDKSGEICDNYATLDDRIVVVHKENGGLSDARNTGLSIAKGEWIGFVDADDYIDVDMYGDLINCCYKYDVKLACCRYDKFGDGICDDTPKDDGRSYVLDARSLLKAIIQPNEILFLSMSVWDRIYHKSIIKGLEFPKGNCYEDIVYSTKAILKAKKSVYINKSYYHYRIREGSITLSDNECGFNKKMISDRLPLQYEQIHLLKTEGYNDLAAIYKASYFQEMLYIKSINTSDIFRGDINRALSEWRLSIGEYKYISNKLVVFIKMLFPNLVIFLFGYKRKSRVM